MLGPRRDDQFWRDDDEAAPCAALRKRNSAKPAIIEPAKNSPGLRLAMSTTAWPRSSTERSSKSRVKLSIVDAAERTYRAISGDSCSMLPAALRMARATP